MRGAGAGRGGWAHHRHEVTAEVETGHCKELELSQQLFHHCRCQVVLRFPRKKIGSRRSLQSAMLNGATSRVSEHAFMFLWALVSMVLVRV